MADSVFSFRPTMTFSHEFGKCISQSFSALGIEENSRENRNEIFASAIQTPLTPTPRQRVLLALKNGHDPVRNPLERFPLEIWAKILSDLDLEDKKNCFHASPLMSLAFPSEAKCDVLLVPVLDILYRPKLGKGVKQTKRKVVVYPTETRHIQSKDIFKLRLVSKAWDENIKEFLTSHVSRLRLEETVRQEYSLLGDTPSHFGFDSIYCSQVYKKRYEKGTTSAFCERYNNPDTAKNKSFRTREVVIQEDPVHQTPNHSVRRFWDEVSFLLERNGKRIYTCTIINNHPCPSPAQIKRIEKFLKLMPNLKVLQWCVRLPSTDDEFQLENKWDHDDLINGFKCPTLPHLEILKVQRIPHPIFNTILKMNPHLSKLVVEEFCQCCDGEKNSLESLQALSDLSCSIYKREEWSTVLKSAEKSNWPLKSLSIHFESPDNYLTKVDNSVRWKNIFKMIGMYGKTLQVLKLKLPQADQTEEDSLTCRLNLPRVKTVRIILQSLASIDFLLPARNSLESLKILIDHCGIGEKGSERVNSGQIIKFHGYHDKMGESNFWEIFSKLRGNYDVGVRKGLGFSPNIYLREHFTIYNYLGKQLECTNGYFFTF